MAKTKDKMAERVMCIPARTIQFREGFSSPKRLLDIWELLDDPAATFKARRDVEEDPAWKQIIPYCMLSRPDGRILQYRRSEVTDRRLDDFWSIGVGGHVNEADRKKRGESGMSVVLNALEREVKEESGYTFTPVGCRIEGVINDNSDPVGRVHLGIVFTVDVPDAPLKLGTELHSPVWTEPAELYPTSMENWSVILIEQFFGHSREVYTPERWKARHFARTRGEVLSAE